MNSIPNPRIAGTVWLKKSWKLNNNPFPTTGIARLGGNDPRENGLLFDPAVSPERIAEATPPISNFFGDKPTIER